MIIKCESNSRLSVRVTCSGTLDRTHNFFCENRFLLIFCHRKDVNRREKEDEQRRGDKREREKVIQLDWKLPTKRERDESSSNPIKPQTGDPNNWKLIDVKKIIRFPVWFSLSRQWNRSLSIYLSFISNWWYLLTSMSGNLIDLL